MGDARCFLPSTGDDTCDDDGDAAADPAGDASVDNTRDSVELELDSVPPFSLRNALNIITNDHCLQASASASVLT